MRSGEETLAAGSAASECLPAAASRAGAAGSGMVEAIVRLAYPCQVWLQFWHTVGLRPASSASNPTGKKQIATTISQAGKLP